MKFLKYIFILLKAMHYIFRIIAIILFIYVFYHAIFFDGNKLSEMLPGLALIMALTLSLACFTDWVFLPLIKYLEKKQKGGTAH